MLKGVLRPGHIQLRVLDLQTAVQHYSDRLGRIEVGPDDQGWDALAGCEEVVRLFTDVLGFWLSEQAVDGELRLAAFLSCSMKAHDVAFIRHEEDARFHHASFHLPSWEAVLRAADIISMHDIALDIGPTRHGL